MTKLLYIEASPRKESSYSSQVAQAFLDAYRDAHPDHEIEHLPLFEMELPEFSAQGASQKMENIVQLFSTGEGIEPEGEWAGVVKEIDRLKSADKVLISCPMWNYSIPYRLKHYIDLVCQPGLTFTMNAEGEYVGLLDSPPLQLILASGSPYAPRFPEASDGTKTDFQRAYLEHIGGFLGFQGISTIKIEPTGLLPPDDLDKLLAEKQLEAVGAAVLF